MSLGIRIGIVVILFAVLGSGFAWLQGGAPGAVRATRWESARQCQECHQDVYEEWRQSHHAIAFTNPEVRRPDMSDDFRKEECMDCHLPRPLAHTGFGKRTLPRRTHFDEGVSCITCHLAADGGILGRNDRPDVPCKPRASAEFLAVDACASCHNQHWTTDQWRASHYPQKGEDCAHCHMPHVERRRADLSTRIGRGHLWPGAHDKNMLAKAGKFTVTRQDAGVTLELENIGAGHNFPTEERHRAVDMMLRFLRADGSATDWQLVHRCRQPYRDEPGENTQLPAGQKVAFTVPIPADAVRAEARLWYRLTPFCDDQDPRSTLLEERTIELR
ncbi:MAG: hypothetical protein IPK26_12530 [Planctomycetes bacterium]|nr:hypothetical protein [Planctomycetota bacterium]